MASALNCLLLALCLGLAYAEPRIDFKSCPSPAVMESFELSDYLGTWYEIERNYNPFETSKHSCGATTISQVDSKFGYNVMFNSTWNVKGKNQGLVTKGRYDAINKSAKLKIKPIPLFPRQDYWVLDTDYKNFAIVWSCAEFYLNHHELVWIFSRERTMRPENRLKAYNSITKLGFKLEDLTVVEHQNC